jgi:hypothetical protein
MQRLPLLAWLFPLVPLALLLVFSAQPERRRALLLQPGQESITLPFRLEGGRWGAPLLDLQVRLPPNSSAGYDVDLLDGRQRPVLQLSKQAWREVTAWSEEGERGVEDLSDTQLRLDLRPTEAGQFQLRVRLEELLDGAGRPLQQPLQAELRIRNHVLNTPLLLFTVVVTAALVHLALRAFHEQGRQRALCWRKEPQLDCRLVMGGAALVRLKIRARYEGGLASQVLQGSPELTLQIYDCRGLRISTQRLPLRARRGGSDGCLWWLLEARLLLRFPEADSRRLRVVLPEQLRGTRATLEWGELTVLEGCRVLWPRPVLTVESQAGGTVEQPVSGA